MGWWNVNLQHQGDGGSQVQRLRMPTQLAQELGLNLPVFTCSVHTKCETRTRTFPNYKNGKVHGICDFSV